MLMPPTDASPSTDQALEDLPGVQEAIDLYEAAMSYYLPAADSYVVAPAEITGSSLDPYQHLG
jgi:hypothetical protein